MKDTEVLLKEHVKNLGKCGDIVRVAPGYARNYLIPRGFAYLATGDAAARIDADALRCIAGRAVGQASGRKTGRVALVTIDSPPVNALSHSVRQGLATMLPEKRMYWLQQQPALSTTFAAAPSTAGRWWGFSSAGHWHLCVMAPSAKFSLLNASSCGEWATGGSQLVT